MLSLELARRLFAAGVMWTPAAGDRFVVENRDMDEEVFVISDMTVEVHEFDTGRVIGFNGTTEWALDSLALTDVLWLPRESQLRELLGDRFDALLRIDDGSGPVYDVRLRPATGVAAGDASPDQPGVTTHRDSDVENAYARALLALAEGQE